MSGLMGAVRHASLILLMAAGGGAAAELDPAKADDLLRIHRKIQCSTIDGEAITCWWHGKAFSRRMGASATNCKTRYLAIAGGRRRACPCLRTPWPVIPEGISGAYHATETFNFMGDIEPLLSEETSTADVQVGWVRMSDWLPWMMMEGREGLIYMHTAGRKLDSWNDLPNTMKQEIEDHYPDYVAPPQSRELNLSICPGDGYF